jgi:hypothetical protein
MMLEALWLVGLTSAYPICLPTCVCGSGSRLTIGFRLLLDGFGTRFRFRTTVVPAGS